MRAALINAFGEPTEVLELADVPEPLGPAAGEVLVGVEYAPVNMNDLYLIQGVDAGPRWVTLVASGGTTKPPPFGALAKASTARSISAVFATRVAIRSIPRERDRGSAARR
jgi:NADPH:quinone reductase-like Zn-dependent oxidoreductase